MQAIGHARVVQPHQPSLAQGVEAAVGSNPSMQDAHWGLVIQDDAGQVLYEHNADRDFVPASNLKLITAATAHAVLGPDSTFKTRLMTTGRIEHGTLHGDLYLVGGGDPSLQTSDLKSAVDALRLHRIAGKIVVDDHVFDNTRLGQGWAWDDLNYGYAAEIDGLTLDENVATMQVGNSGITPPPDEGYLLVDNQTKAGSTTRLTASRELGTNQVTVGGTVAPGPPAPIGVTVHDPALYAGNVLKGLCRAAGIEVHGEVKRGQCPQDASALWEKSSAPLLDLERHMLKQSDNLYAETLFRALAGGQSAAAPAVERQTLGIQSPTRIVDGSGLSRYDLVSPRLLSSVIQQQYRDPGLRSCLPVANVDGTLVGRMPSLTGRVQAKTGTMADVSSLSGWLQTRDGKQVSFSWMCNGYPSSGSPEKNTEDAVMVAIDNTLSP